MVGGGAMYIAAGVASFYFDTVSAAHRGHNLQLALLHTRLAEASSQGCIHACAPTPLGGSAEQNMRRAGLDQAYERLNYVTK